MQLADGHELSELTMDLPEEVSAAAFIDEISDHLVVAAVIGRRALSEPGDCGWDVGGQQDVAVLGTGRRRGRLEFREVRLVR